MESRNEKIQIEFLLRKVFKNKKYSILSERLELWMFSSEWVSYISPYFFNTQIFYICTKIEIAKSKRYLWLKKFFNPSGIFFKKEVRVLIKVFYNNENKTIEMVIYEEYPSDEIEIMQRFFSRFLKTRIVIKEESKKIPVLHCWAQLEAEFRSFDWLS